MLHQQYLDLEVLEILRDRNFQDACGRLRDHPSTPNCWSIKGTNHSKSTLKKTFRTNLPVVSSRSAFCLCIFPANATIATCWDGPKLLGLKMASPESMVKNDHSVRKAMVNQPMLDSLYQPFTIALLLLY